ncbi:MAG: alpha-L-rhamnosidase domain protein [Acidimicrobiales bacterium]|jgi:alpha-L-rhamnosidase|nr:alpha-L-rhamnosidase domain protein [Acidimicrobiales bacterium]
MGGRGRRDKTGWHLSHLAYMGARPLGSGTLWIGTALVAGLALIAPRVEAGAATAPMGPGVPVALTVDDLAAPVGLDQRDIFFGWHVNDSRRGAVQSAYRILVSRPVLAGTSRGSAPAVWDSGKVPSATQAFVPYGGPALAADTTYQWTVQTWDRSGNSGPMAPTATFDTGLRDGDWHADWIKRLTVEPSDSADSFALQNGFGVWENKDEYSYVRKETKLSGSPIVRARAYISADQQYELYVNGALAGKGQAYQFPDSQYYETQDITGLVRAGVANAFGIIYNWQGPGKGRAAGTPGVIAHISVLHRDGSSEVITTDGTWRVLPGAWLPGTQRDEEGDPVDYTENINGPAQPLGWDRPGYLAAAWTPATVIGPHPVAPWSHLISVRTRIVYEPVHAASINKLPSGAVVADFGKVYAAIPSVTFRHGLPGHLVTMHSGFVLDQSSGNVSVTRGTQHTDMSYSYVERGGTETFRPFDYLGFRYLQIDDPGEALSAKDVIVFARHASVPDERAGVFSSSDPTVDAVFDLGAHSALFTMQEQFVDTPTREKGSWLGDGRNESQTAMDAFGDVNMTRKSLFEFAQSQTRFWPNGAINKLYPTSLGAQEIPEGTEVYPDWVWQYWMHTGDRAALAMLYPVVVKVSDHLWSFVNRADGLITNMTGNTSAFAFPADAQLNLLAVNVFHRVGDMARALGRPTAELALQQNRAATVTAGINTRLVAPDGTYDVGLDANGTRVAAAPTSLNAASRQSDNAYALQFGVVPAARIALVARYVASQHMSTPPIFAGDLLQALGAAGDDPTMLHLLTDATEPGWANILARGGTFGWEVWNPTGNDVVVGGTPLGSFFGNGDSMSHGFSSNVLVAIQQTLLGVTPVAPGFASFDLTPPLHVLAYASGSVPTPHGTIEVHWSRPTAGTVPFEVDVTVPPNTSATVRLPARDVAGVKDAGVAIRRARGVASVRMDGAYAVVKVGAGSYRLTSSHVPAAASSPISHPPAAVPGAPPANNRTNSGISGALDGARRSGESRRTWPLGLITASVVAVAVGWTRRRRD